MNEIARSRQIVPLLQPKAVTSNAMNTDMDILEDDLSSATGTKTLVAHNLMPDGLPTSREAEQQIHHIGGTFRNEITHIWPRTRR
jgi:hypothetical protein